MPVNYIPEGYSDVTPYYLVDDIKAFIKFLEDAFGGKVLFSMEMPDGGIGHTEMMVGDTKLMMSPNCMNNSLTSAASYLYVKDADATFKQAIAAGATEHTKLETQFYGDRVGAVNDKFGNIWWIATHVEEVSPQEIKRRMAARAAKGA